MKRPNLVRLSLTVSAGAALFGIVFSTVQCGVGPVNNPNTCFVNPPPTCMQPSDCTVAANVPLCGVAAPGCGESSQCSFVVRQEDPGHCPCMEGDTRACTKADGSQASQKCGRANNNSTKWCGCT